MNYPANSSIPLISTPLQLTVSAYEQSQMGKYIAGRVFPNVPVRRRTGDFWKVNPSDWLRNQVQKRKSGTIALRGGWRYAEGPQYRIIEYTAKTGIPRQDRKEQMENGLPDPVITNRRWVMEQLFLNREIIFASRYASAGVWDTEWDGTAGAPGADQFLHWSDAASTPIDDVADFVEVMYGKTGLAPNTMLIPRAVARTLKTHPQVLEYSRSVSQVTGDAIPTEAFIRGLFDIPNVILVDSVKNTAGPEATDPTLAQIFGDNISFFYTGMSGDFANDPSAGHILSWSDTDEGTSENGVVLDEWYDRDTKSFITEGSMFFDMMASADNLGGIMVNVLA